MRDGDTSETSLGPGDTMHIALQRWASGAMNEGFHFDFIIFPMIIVISEYIIKARSRIILSKYVIKLSSPPLSIRCILADDLKLI